MRLVFLCLFCIGFIGAAGAERPLDAPDQREQVRHEKFLQDYPGSAAIHSSYAEFLADRGNLRAAVVHWRTAQQLDPGNAAIANSLGGAYLQMGEAAASAAGFARAIDLDRDNAAYRFNLANVEFMLRHDLAAAWKMQMPDLLRHALAEFQEASRLSPKNLEYARAYAETFYAMPTPDWSAAEAAWKHVLFLSAERDFAYLHLARVRLNRGDATGARQFLSKVVDGRHDDLKRKLRAQADRL